MGAQRLRAAGAALLAAIPFLVAAYGLLLNASLGRPIWIDEFLHFALAAEASTRDAWRVATSTFGNINHGQTGIYMMLNYWTLAITGPSELALRMPSLVAGAMLLGSAIFLFKVLGFGVVWQLVAVLALLGQHSVMYFAGEARPYMPLVGSTVAMLTYYVARPHHPGSWGLMIFGASVALVGVLMHPYFAVYWPAVCLVAWVHHATSGRVGWGFRALIRFVNPALVGVGIALFFGLGMATWLVEGPKFAFDPFQWIGPAGIVVSFTRFSHTQFLSGSYNLAGAFSLILVAGLLPWPRLRPRMRALIAPALLIAVALALSILVAWLSYRVNYWILGRQWVASAALVAIGLVWLWAEAARIWNSASRVLGVAALGVACIVVYGQAANIHRVRTEQFRSWVNQTPMIRDNEDCRAGALPDRNAMSGQARNDYFVELANRNIRCGGPVWPEIGEYYRPIFEDWERRRNAR